MTAAVMVVNVVVGCIKWLKGCLWLSAVVVWVEWFWVVACAWLG